MTARVVDGELNGLRWLRVGGDRTEVFRAVGAAAADEIRESLAGLPENEELHRFAASAAGQQVVQRVLESTRRDHPDEYAEALALAAGAGVDPSSLLLANLRGDLGGDDRGCSDLAWRGSVSMMAHNEDGAPVLEGRLVLLTLAIEGAAPVTVQWYPGMMPSNTFAVTGHGLAWGINHLQVPDPAAAAGRYFVARALQAQPDLDAAVRFLAGRPSAGGLAYTIGELGTGRIVTVETAAGRTRWVEADPRDAPLLWHTNHLRHLDETPAGNGDPAPGRGKRDLGQRNLGQRNLGQREESVARGAVLSALTPPQPEPGVGWFLDVLTASPVPQGVYRSATGDDPLLTLCTTVVDLTAQEVTLVPRGRPPVTLTVDALTAG